MITNNRPMVKEIRYIWITKDGEEISLAFAQDGNGNGDWSVYGYKPTGKTKEIERPMYDTEYIEYLEKELELAKQMNQSNIIMRDDAFAYGEKLEKQNQELKANSDNLFNTFNEVIGCFDWLNEEYKKSIKEVPKFNNIQKINHFIGCYDFNDVFENKQDYLLKIVDDVLHNHQISQEWDNPMVCACDNWCDIGGDSYREHLLQEIKSAMEKKKQNDRT